MSVLTGMRLTLILWCEVVTVSSVLVSMLRLFSVNVTDGVTCVVSVLGVSVMSIVLSV